ncbi:MaoC family dehydratase [Virgibacillus siamensis]|uniref:MaoC family dehydratase n=1 Tax=Virgibacillus siamensis TaxID=480071 RepID=UPI001C37D27F|nr:MaoC/PaaZ C-terminal domain-containing protein [Virgibacillus siamensis]
MQPLVEEIFPKTIETTLTAEMVEHYAVVSGDDNPIHLSKRAASQAGFPNKVAHGMLTMAISTQLVSPLLGKTWMIQSVASTFLSPVYVNDQLTITGFVSYYRDGVLRIKIQAQNQNRKMVMRGKVTLEA